MPLGQTNNPNGRTPGSRNERTEDVWKALEARGDKDPLTTSHLHSLPTKLQKRASASRPQTTSFRTSIRSVVRRPLPVTSKMPSQTPEFVSILEAENFLADISRRAGAGELELQSALDVSTLVKNWILSVNSRQEFDLKVAAQGGGSDQTIRIEGGLPPLPGTNVIMSETAIGTNGHNGTWRAACRRATRKGIDRVVCDRIAQLTRSS